MGRSVIIRGEEKPQAVLPEFYGWGAVTRGHLDAPGGFDTYFVTSLADTNTPGTLRHAILSLPAGNIVGRRIVFAVGGDMTLTSTLQIRERRYITIDGLTAPDPGFLIITPLGTPDFFTALSLESTSIHAVTDIIIRGLHFDGRGAGIHPGSGDILSLSGSSTGVGVSRCIFDRNSCRAAADGIFDIFRKASDLSFTRNLIAETVEATNLNTLGGDPPGSADRDRITWAHNVWTHNNGRQPRLTWRSWDLEVVNNIVHGWGLYQGGAQGIMVSENAGQSDAAHAPKLNFEDNRYIFVDHGPLEHTYVPDEAVLFLSNVPDSQPSISQVYMSGNVLPPGESTIVGNAPRIVIPEQFRVPRIQVAKILEVVGARQRRDEEQDLIDGVAGAI